MKELIKKLLDITFWKFILVGIVNTFFGTLIMFLFYNIIGFNYWISSASNYIFGSILSFFLNKNFTFRNKSKDKKTIVKFIVNILACYLVAYGAARPIVRMILHSHESIVQDNAAMLVGMGVFIILNYLGQRFWAFKEEN